MTLNIMVPVTIDNTALDAAGVPENDYTAWSAVTAYVVGDRAMITGTTHRNYECIVAHTNKSPLVAANLAPATGAYWVTVGATNRWKPFDNTISDLCTLSGNIGYRILASGQIDTVAMYGITGGDVQVAVYDTDVSRINLITYSEEFDDAAHVKSAATIAMNEAKDPWGAFYADAIIEDTATSQHYKESSSISFVSGTTYTHSIYVKRRAPFAVRDVRLLLPAAAFTAAQTGTFDLGAVSGVYTGGCTGAITGPDAYGYYRVSITATATATVAGVARVGIYNGAISYTGNATSGLLISSEQVNTGALATYQWIRGASQFGNMVYNQTQNKNVLRGGNSSEVIFTGLPADVGDYIGFSINATSGTAQVGEVAMGLSYPMGGVSSATLGILDYSKKEMDTFGNTSIIRRNFANTVDYVVNIEKSQAAQWRNFLAYVRAVPVVYYDTDDTGAAWGLSVFGFYKEFSNVLTSANTVFVSLRVEGVV